jgi:tripartite-type tricarboxylate transporter receptor subunit TctC
LKEGAAMKRYLFIIASITYLGSAPVLAQAPFEPKQIRLVLGAAAGQDYDVWARLIGRHIQRRLPSNPPVVTVNMPGAGHLIATNWLYNAAPRDGSVWGMVSRNAPSQAFLKAPAAKFDPLRFIWIGSPELTNRGCFAMTSSGVTQAKQLFSQELVVGGTGAGSAVSQTPALLNGLLGMKFKTIEGYQKPQDIVRAMESGEISAICQTVQSFMRERPHWFTTGLAKLLFTLERKPVTGLGVPTIYEFAETEDQRKVLDFYSASIELGRPIFLPPEVPEDRVDIIRKAFAATMDDKEFRDEAERLKLDVMPRSGEELQELIYAASTTEKRIMELTAKLTGGSIN